MTDPWVSAVIEKIGLALTPYFFTPATVPNLTETDKVPEAIWCLKERRVRCHNVIPSIDLKLFPQRAFSLLAQIFIAVLRIHHFPKVWKDVKLICLCPYRPINVLDTFGKLFEKSF